MSDEWKANCVTALTDYVEFSARRVGGMLLSATEQDDRAHVALSPESCRSLCAWLVERGFGADVPANAPAQVDEREQQQAAVHGNCIAALEALCAAQHKRIDDLTERLGYLENWRVHMERFVDNNDDRITVLENRFASMKDAING